jgi:hypothetical protein
MPFSGDPTEFIPYARDNHDELANQLEVWAWEWLETNCATWRWWAPTRRSLAEIFGVGPDHQAGDIARAYTHFDKNPKDLNVADVVEPGERGEVGFSILRTPDTQTYQVDQGELAGSFWGWFHFMMIKLADKLDNRMLQIIRSVYSRLHHNDLPQGASATELKLMSIEIPDRAAWLIHETAAGRITDGPLNSTTLGAPVVQVRPFPADPNDPSKIPSSMFLPSTCIVRSERLGYHFAVADSLRVKIDPTSEIEATIDIDIWSGIGVDTTTGKVNAVAYDLGVKEGI